MKIDFDPSALANISGIRERDIPYILMLSVNNTAFDAMNSFREQVSGKLKVSKKSVISSWRVKKATKSNPVAEVYVDEWSWQHKVLAHHHYGGDRHRKGFEKALIHTGAMRRDEILTPATGVKLRPSAYVRMMSQLKLNYKAGYMANETSRSRKRKRKVKERYILIPSTSYMGTGIKPGIYARMAGVEHPIAILRISKKPNYKKIFDLEDTVTKVYERRANKHLSKAIDRVLYLNAKRGWK